VAGSSSPSKLASAGRAAVSALQTERWTDAIDRLDEIQELGSTVSREERELYPAVDALREAALGLRNEAEKRGLRRNVTTRRIQDLAVLTEGVADLARRTGHAPSYKELREAEQRPGSHSGRGARGR